MEDRFNAVKGHKRQKDILNRQLENDQISHAYLFTGPEGIGKRMIAEELAVDIIKSGLRNKLRHVTLQHADIIRKGLEDENINVATIREVIDETKTKPLEGTNRVIIIDHADKINEVAQNALLKTIEEPNPGNTFILITNNPTKLLPTIKSRCQELPFHDLTEEEKIEIINEHGLDQEGADLTETPGHILENLENPEYLKELEDLYARLKKVIGGDRLEVFFLAEDLGQNQKLSQAALNLFLRRLHAQIISENGMDPHKIDVINILFDLLERMTFNVNLKLQWEGCLVKIVSLAKNPR